MAVPLEGGPTDLESDLRSIGRGFLAARRRRGLTQRGLEGMSCVPQSTISRLENGKMASVRVSHLARLVHVLGRVTIEPLDEHR
jgi:transcriptional regulator with XRE-family HTH domain